MTATPPALGDEVLVLVGMREEGELGDPEEVRVLGKDQGACAVLADGCTKEWGTYRMRRVGHAA
jgi:hypothetical protein